MVRSFPEMPKFYVPAMTSFFKSDTFANGYAHLNSYQNNDGV